MCVGLAGSSVGLVSLPAIAIAMPSRFGYVFCYVEGLIRLPIGY